VLYKIHPCEREKLREKVQSCLDELPEDGSKNACCLYSGSRFSEDRRTRIISTSLSFRYEDRKAEWSMNIGIATLILEGQLTFTDKDILIVKGGHLSHLCGNWTS
jgi:hypothetical protein